MNSFVASKLAKRPLLNWPHNTAKTQALRLKTVNWVTKTPDLYVPEFKHQVETLPVGSISEPFKTVHGWHIVEVLDRRQVDRTDSAMKNKAYRILFNRKFNEEAGAWMQELRASAFVEIVDDNNDN